MKVVMFVSNSFTHDPRVYMEARSLVKAGHDVRVIASASPQHHLTEELDGIHVSRVKLSVPASRAFGTAFWGPIGRGVWQWRAYGHASRMYRKGVFDVVHCHDLDTLAIGVALKRRFGVRLIYDAHEIYGYMAARVLPKWLANALLWWEKRLTRYADQVINTDEAQYRYFQSVTDRPISIVMNCKALQTTEYEPPAPEGCLRLLYVGSVHQGRGIDILIDAVGALEDVRCVIGGIGETRAVQALRDKCAATRNAEFVGSVAIDRVLPLTREADAVFFLLNPVDPNNRDSLGNKQFEAMVCGRPIICTKGTYSGDLTEQEEVGLTVEYNKESLKEAIVRLRDDADLRERLGRNALRAAVTKYNWEQEEAKLLAIYEGLGIGEKERGPGRTA